MKTTCHGRISFKNEISASKEVCQRKKNLYLAKTTRKLQQKETFQDNHWTLSIIAHTAVAALIAICYINLLLGSSAIKKGIGHI